MVLSLKANRKRVIAFLILVVVVVGACIFLHNGKGKEEQKEFPGGTNEERVAFLQSFGWQLDETPAETREVMIPAQFNDVYTTYNVMQKAQGFDLKPYAGETCTQYRYKINNYPNVTEVYATLLVYGKLIIGGDLACAEVDGFMHGFAADSARYGETAESRSKAPESSSAESAVVSSSPSSAVESTAAGEGQTASAVSSAASAVEGDADMASSVPEVESGATEETAGEPEDNIYPTD